MSIELITFGCRLNTYESEVIKDHARAAGLTDTVIINTCAVTAEAERQARQSIRRLRREKPGARIIVTGCAAQIHPETFAAMEEVDAVLGNEEKLREGEWKALNSSPHPASPRKQGEERVRVNDISSLRETASHMVAAFDGKSRAFIQVQNGCDHRCTFCIIPFGRGPSRSVPMGEIAAQVRHLVEQGVKEVVLTGVDVSDYGKDLPGQPTLGQMMRRLLASVPELPRLRLSSIDAAEVDADLLTLLANEPRLMPHLHISVQAGDDMILKRMKRRHSRADILDFCAQVRSLRPDTVFGADLIAGFPTETEAMFDNTLALVDEAGLSYLHVFPYSARKGTPAARMPQVPKDIRKARAARLRAAGQAQLAAYLRACVGTQDEVLVENDGTGRTRGFATVAVGNRFPAGSLVSMRVTGVAAGMLEAEAV